MKKIPPQDLLKRKQSFEILERVKEPATFWKYFALCLETPRPSGNLSKIQTALLNVGKRLGLETETDEVGNILIRKPG